VYGVYGVGARLVAYRFVGRVNGMCTGGEARKVSRSLSGGEGVLDIRGGAMWAVGVMNIEDTRLDVYRLEVSAGGVISRTRSRGGEAGGCCGMMGMWRGIDGARRGTEGALCTIAGASTGRVGALCGGYTTAAVAGGLTPSDMAETTAFGRCFGEYRCVPCGEGT
jgi:hypothetical protein